MSCHIIQKHVADVLIGREKTRGNGVVEALSDSGQFSPRADGQGTSNVRFVLQERDFRRAACGTSGASQW